MAGRDGKNQLMAMSTKMGEIGFSFSEKGGNIGFSALGRFGQTTNLNSPPPQSMQKSFLEYWALTCKQKIYEQRRIY
jgi:hypothetical protein